MIFVKVNDWFFFRAKFTSPLFSILFNWLINSFFCTGWLTLCISLSLSLLMIRYLDGKVVIWTVARPYYNLCTVKLMLPRRRERMVIITIFSVRSHETYFQCVQRFEKQNGWIILLSCSVCMVVAWEIYCLSKSTVWPTIFVLSFFNIIFFYYL